MKPKNLIAAGAFALSAQPVLADAPQNAVEANRMIMAPLAEIVTKDLLEQAADFCLQPASYSPLKLAWGSTFCSAAVNAAVSEMARDYLVDLGIPATRLSRQYFAGVVNACFPESLSQEGQLLRVMPEVQNLCVNTVIDSANNTGIHPNPYLLTLAILHSRAEEPGTPAQQKSLYKFLTPYRTGFGPYQQPTFE